MDIHEADELLGKNKLKRRYCAVTMCRDESFFMPIWHRYYASQFGEKNFFIIDHNSLNATARAILPDTVNITSLPFDTPTADKDAKNRKSFDE